MPETVTPADRSWRLRALLAGLLAVAVALGLWLRPRADRPQPAPRPPPINPAEFLDRPLGHEGVEGVADSGFYGDENNKDEGGPFRWTDGTARLEVPVGASAPRSLGVRLGVGIPKPARLRVLVNGRPLCDEQISRAMGWARAFDLAGVSFDGKAVVEILSDTFVPEGGDRRQLGVVVREVTLNSGARDFTGVTLGAAPIASVVEQGFYPTERAGGVPLRWSDGAARLWVPVGDRKPRALAVACEVPDRPDYRVRVAVNGRALFDGALGLPRVNPWTIELPLAGVELGGLAAIELDSSSIVPGKTNPKSTDMRSLGVRVKSVVLLAADAAAPPG